MGKPVLSKSGLQKERENLRLYERVLPSLDLKRMQLTAELKRAQQKLIEVQAEETALMAESAKKLPMIADREFELSGLLELESMEIQEENRMGVRLPRLEDVKCRVTPYAFLARPHWVDALVKTLDKMIFQKALVQVMTERVRLLEQALRKVTQRTNLFEKILIPETRKNIRKIQIFLADADRAAVVRSKITKRIRQKQAQSFMEAVS